MSEALIEKFYIMLLITMDLNSLSDGLPMIPWYSQASLAMAISFLLKPSKNFRAVCMKNTTCDFLASMYDKLISFFLNWCCYRWNYFHGELREDQ